MAEATVISRSKRNVFLDLFRFLLSFMVICIHLTGETYSIYPLYRLAVPAFFMISGYFLYSDSADGLKRKAHAFALRSAKYMIIGTAIYALFEIVSAIESGTSLGWIFTTFFYEGENFFFRFFILNAPVPYYTVGAQLWFLVALFVVSLVHMLLVHIGRTDLYKIIVPVAFLVYFFFSGFMYFIQPDAGLNIRYMRNAWFFGLPNIGLGYLSARINWHKKSFYKWIYLVLGLVLFFLQIPEASLYPEGAMLEMYLSGVASALLLIQFLVGIKSPTADGFYRWVGKSASFYIYILHMGVAVVLSRYVALGSSMKKCVVVFVISFAIYEVIFLITRLISRLRSRSHSVAY